jgi:hypothetical protein
MGGEMVEIRQLECLWRGLPRCAAAIALRRSPDIAHETQIRRYSPIKHLYFSLLFSFSFSSNALHTSQPGALFFSQLTPGVQWPSGIDLRNANPSLFSTRTRKQRMLARAVNLRTLARPAAVAARAMSDAAASQLTLNFSTPHDTIYAAKKVDRCVAASSVRRMMMMMMMMM